MNNNRRANESGMSLIEMMIVLVITAILVAVAIAQFDDAKKDFQVQNVAKELQAFLVRARYDSVKRRPSGEAEMAGVTIDSATSFTVNLDLNQNGTLDPGDTKVVDFTGNNDVSILGDGVVLPIKMIFDRHGHVNAFDSLGNLVTPKFVVCDNCANQDGSTALGYRIELSSSGTVSMQATSASHPVFATPAVSVVPDGEDVNSLVKVDTSSSTSPSPSTSPSASPSSSTSPTATPTPSGTQTQTPIPTATPTPTPIDICARNERPAHTGCVCQSPYSVRSNGQCK